MYTRRLAITRWSDTTGIALGGLLLGLSACVGDDPSSDPMQDMDSDTSTGTVEHDESAADGDDMDGGSGGEEDDGGPADSGPNSDGGDDSDSDDDSTGEPPPPAAQCEDSVLADIVATMEPGSWAQMPDNDSLINLPIHRALLYWADSAVYDVEQRQLHWIGGPGTCCADPATYQRMTYDEMSDTWSIVETPLEGAGHSYDGNAFEPGTNNHYFAKFHEPAVHVHDGDSWDLLPEIPFNPPATMGLTWFPEMDGLVYVGGHGDAGIFDGTEWTVVTGVEEPWGSYNVFSEHSPVHGVVWLGGGNGAGKLSYTLDATGALTRQPESPVNLGNGTALHAVDPVGGNFIVHHLNSEQWWELDPAAEQWSEIVMDDAPNFIGSVFQVAIPHCGVILYFDHYWEQRYVHLYRHS